MSDTIERATPVLSPVLNLYDDTIVMLPLEHPLLVDQNEVFARKDLGCLAIAGCDYDKLVALLDLTIEEDEYGEEVNHTENFFVSRCKYLSGHSIPTMSDDAYRIIFKALAYDEYLITDMIQALPQILKRWYEQTDNEVIESLNIRYDASKDDKSEVILNKLENSHNLKFHKYHYVNGLGKWLYSN